MADDLDQSDQGQGVHRHDPLDAGFLHGRAPDAEKGDIRMKGPEGLDQGGPVIVAGFLSGHDEDGARAHFSGRPIRTISGWAEGSCP